MDTAARESNWVNTNVGLFDAASNKTSAWNPTNIQIACVMSQSGTPAQKEEARAFFMHHLYFHEKMSEPSIVPVAPWSTMNTSIATDLLNSKNKEEVRRGCMYFEHHMALIRKRL